MTNGWFLVFEKIPLFALAAGSCAATILTQGEAISEGNRISFSARILNALVSYMAYLGKFFYPAGLAARYPHPRADLPAWKVVVALLLLASISLAVMACRRRPYVLVGWLWYLGMLVPVIGLVQVGGQAMADRYTYLPQIGLCVALAWGAAQTAASWPHRRWVCGAGSALLLAILIASAWRQATFWRDNKTLWTHAIACTSGNALAYTNLGNVLGSEGRLDEAIEYYRKAVQAQPDFFKAHFNLGNALLYGKGQRDEAIAHYQKALKIKPDFAEGHCDLGDAFFFSGRLDEAIAEYRRTLEINPDIAGAHYNLASALHRKGRFDEAKLHYQKALKLKPDLPSPPVF